MHSFPESSLKDKTSLTHFFFKNFVLGYCIYIIFSCVFLHSNPLAPPFSQLMISFLFLSYKYVQTCAYTYNPLIPFNVYHICMCLGIST